MRRDSIDFHLVEPAHYKIHERLENWSRWANGRPHAIVQPMFQQYRADNFDREPTGMVIDRLDAQRVQKAVSALPANHRAAVTWQYVAPSSPIKMARTLAVSMAGLAELVRAARTMLINRGV